jgi:hypothetical protein
VVLVISDLVDTLRVESLLFLHTDFYVSGRSVHGAGLPSHSKTYRDRYQHLSPESPPPSGYMFEFGRCLNKRHVLPGTSLVVREHWQCRFQERVFASRDSRRLPSRVTKKDLPSRTTRYRQAEALQPYPAKCKGRPPSACRLDICNWANQEIGLDCRHIDSKDSGASGAAGEGACGAT